MSKNYTHRLILASLAVIFSLTAGVIVTSCQKEAVSPEPELSKGVQPQADWTYLDFTEDFTGDFDDPKDSNSLVLMEAIKRARLSQKDGWWEIAATSPEQVKVSPAVFEQVLQVAGRGNAVITEDLKNASLVPKTRQGWEKPGLIKPTRNDCFASCVDAAGNKLGYPNANHAAANAYVNRFYGDGIPQNQVFPSLQYIFGKENVSRYSMGNIGSYNSDQSQIMLLFGTGAGEGHAVMYWGADSDSTYMITDPQNRNIPYPVNKSDVTDAFLILRNH